GGILWGLPQTGEVCGIFYSATKLEALGVEAPTSWDEVYSLVETALEAGQLPIKLGNLEQWPALHVFGPLQADFVPTDTITTLAMGNEGADWTSPENLDALSQLADWAGSGALGDSP